MLPCVLMLFSLCFFHHDFLLCQDLCPILPSLELLPCRAQIGKILYGWIQELIKYSATLAISFINLFLFSARMIHHLLHLFLSRVATLYSRILGIIFSRSAICLLGNFSRLRWTKCKSPVTSSWTSLFVFSISSFSLPWFLGLKRNWSFLPNSI